MRANQHSMTADLSMSWRIIKLSSESIYKLSPSLLLSFFALSLSLIYYNLPHHFMLDNFWVAFLIFDRKWWIHWLFQPILNDLRKSKDHFMSVCIHKFETRWIALSSSRKFQSMSWKVEWSVVVIVIVIISFIFSAHHPVCKEYRKDYGIVVSLLSKTTNFNGCFVT